MTIKKIQLKDFKGHRDITVELSQLTVLVGPNGAGKTSVLTALHDISRLVKESFDDVFQGMHNPSLIARAGASAFRLELTGTPSWTATLAAENSENKWYGDFSGIEDILNLSQVGMKTLASTVFLRLDARRLAEPCALVSHPRIEFDGAGLAAVLAELKLTDDERLDKIQEALKKVVPNFRRLRIGQTDVEREVRFIQGNQVTKAREQTAGYQVLFDFHGAPGIPAHNASEGTLIALGLFTLLHASTLPRLILLDDLEHGLHPGAQVALIKVIRQILADHPELQIVATTHSPYLLDELEADEVRVISLGEDGTPTCRALSEHPDAERDLKGLMTGEFWSACGEDWVHGNA